MIFLKLQIIFALLTSSNRVFAWIPWWDKCYNRPLQPQICAILFKSENCRGDPIPIPDTKGQPYTLHFVLRDEIESLIVKRGCNLEVHSDSKCRYHMGRSFPFNNRYKISDLIIKDLEGSIARYRGKFRSLILSVFYIK